VRAPEAANVRVLTRQMNGAAQGRRRSTTRCYVRTAYMVRTATARNSNHDRCLPRTRISEAALCAKKTIPIAMPVASVVIGGWAINTSSAAKPNQATDVRCQAKRMTRNTKAEFRKTLGRSPCFDSRRRRYLSPKYEWAMPTRAKMHAAAYNAAIMRNNVPSNRRAPNNLCAALR
jgi:hypothetical protein